MGLIKKFMRWDEPKAIRKKYYPYPLFPFWSHIVFVGVVIVFALIAFLIRPDDPQGDKLLMLGIGVFMAAFAGYGIPLIDSIGGATITIGRAGIERMDSSIGYSIPILMLLKFRYRRWKWKDIASLYLQTEESSNRTIQILEIVGHNEEKLGVVGLPVKNFKMDKLLAVLEENNCCLYSPDSQI